MKKDEHIFTEDIVIPDIVMQKAEDAFSQIKMEDEKIMNFNEKSKNKGKKKVIFKSQAAAIACVCVLGIGTVSAVASIHHYWGRGMQGMIQATDEQQHALADQGMAAVLSEQANYEDMAVTDGNVTITPKTVIADGKYAYVSFDVHGYNIGKDVEPGFESVVTYLGDDSVSEQDGINMGGYFYDGIVADETGSPVYDDGSPMAYSEDGNYISHYVNEEGDLEYVLCVSTADPQNSILGKMLHVDFKNLGTLAKAECTVATEGEWDFAIPLPDVSAATDIQIGKEITGTVFTLDAVALSPISIKMNYTVNGAVQMSQDENGVPRFCGVVLKDGTKLPYLSNGESTGYTDETMAEAYVLSSFDRVIEVDQVKSLLVQTQVGAELTEIPME